MVKLSDRLQLMADCIKKGETMADIGTDHGFLPLYLYERGICEKIILADVSAGSLDKAIGNCKALHNAGDFRLGDGLNPIDFAEVDVITIAGMGGRLMTSILGDNIIKTRSFKRFILQPRNGQAELRFWLKNNDFEIEKELLVREGKFICEIIVAVPIKSNKRVDFSLPSAEEKIKYELPIQMFDLNKELALELFERHLVWQNKILDSMNSTERCVEKKLLSELKIKYIREVIENGSQL